jgi:hypothetical protein
MSFSQTAFELLGPGKARLGSNEFIAQCLDAARADGMRYVIEVTADSRQQHGQHLTPHGLREIRPKDLPNGFYLSMERLDATHFFFRNIHFLTIFKKDDRLKLEIMISFDHADWHLPVSLAVFSDQYVAALCENSAVASGVQSEYGVDVTYSFIVAPDEDLYLAFQQGAGACLRKYRECIASGYGGTAQKVHRVASSLSTDLDGHRWWIRYVVVPIVGSGTFAAVVAALLSLFK